MFQHIWIEAGWNCSFESSAFVVKTVIRSPTFLKEPIQKMEELKLNPHSFWSSKNLASNTTYPPISTSHHQFSFKKNSKFPLPLL